MYSIGEFSRISGLTIKTLRFYHELGLLVPCNVDDESGYRYYDHRNIETARVITHLRGLDLSLDEIGEILKTTGDDTDVRDVLLRKRAELQARPHHERQIVRSIDALLLQDEEARKVMAQASFEVVEKELEESVIACIRTKGKYSDCGKLFAAIYKQFGRTARGKPFLLHYDTDYRENDADFEACVPIRGGESKGEISARTLPAGRCVTLLHQGGLRATGPIVRQDLALHQRTSVRGRCAHARDLPQGAGDDFSW